MGEATRQLFFDARRRLPNRVVIHKRTPFRDPEKEGFLEGLGKVDQVEMLEITIDPMVRYIASRPDRDGGVKAGAYPVERGSAIVLEQNRALLWVHGAAANVAGEGKRPYYQGKSRIPAPLVLKRHYGEAELSVVAREILGLSKMNWNTFDYYKKMPATIESSNRIARIGRLLDRFGPATFDYRLFI